MTWLGVRLVSDASGCCPGEPWFERVRPPQPPPPPRQKKRPFGLLATGKRSHTFDHFPWSSRILEDQTRVELRRAIEEYTDYPLLGLSLPGGILHSYYALATAPRLDVFDRRVGRGGVGWGNYADVPQSSKGKVQSA